MCQPIVNTRPRRFGLLTAKGWCAVLSLTYGVIVALQELQDEANRNRRLNDHRDELVARVDELDPSPAEPEWVTEHRRREARAFVDAVREEGAVMAVPVERAES
jgi:hypothetical protein